MLALRMQRIGRSGHAQYRLIIQDSRFSPKSGRVVEYLGSYNPHTKVAILNKEKAEAYLKNGAQPSDAFARLLKKEGVKLPKWAKLDEPKKRSIKNVDKLKRNRPKDAPAAEAPKETEEPVEQEAAAATQPEAADDTAAAKEATEAQPEEEQSEAPAETTQEQPVKAEAPAEPEQEAAPTQPSESAETNEPQEAPAEESAEPADAQKT